MNREVFIEKKNMAAFLIAAGLIGRREEEPDFIKPTDGHLFDINSNSTGEVAKVVLEELKTRNPAKRITNSEPVKTFKGKPQIEFSDYNVHARAEFKATQRSFELAKNNCNLIFWISAEDGAMGLDEKTAKEKKLVYSNGRFNIYFKTVENGEIVLKGKHLPLDIDRFKSFELGKKLVEFGGKTVGDIETVEDLRVQPIGFQLENPDNWINECRKMMPEFEDFWKAIENGDDVKQEEKVAKEVEKAKLIAKGDNAIFQREMERRGYEINKMGIHGTDYLGNQRDTIYNYKIEVVGGKFFTEPVIDKQGNLICPVCGATVSSSASKCGKCGIGLKKNSTE